MKTENIIETEKPHNIMVPFNVPGKPDIGLFDLNKIFQVNLNYNFDSLKTLLEGLVSSYKKNEEEIEKLKENCKEKDMKIDELEGKIIDLNILINSSLGDNEAVEKLKDMKSKFSIGQYNLQFSPQVQSQQMGKEKKDEKDSDKEKQKQFRKPNRTKRVHVPKRRKKIHAPINNDVKLEIKLENDDLINRIIVSIK
jgi:hypothetical protein